MLYYICFPVFVYFFTDCNRSIFRFRLIFIRLYDEVYMIQPILSFSNYCSYNRSFILLPLRVYDDHLHVVYRSVKPFIKSLKNIPIYIYGMYVVNVKSLSYLGVLLYSQIRVIGFGFLLGLQ